jgi:hypothetical protein
VTRRYLGTSVIVLLALPAAAAQVDTSELVRCHAIAAREERLNCYEALAESAITAHATGASAPTGANAPPRASAPTGAGTPTEASSSGGASAVMSAIPTPRGGLAAAPAPATNEGPAPGAGFNPDDPANFGLNRHQVDPHSATETGSIKSVVSQITEDRRHNITVVLDNGQTWAFIEPQSRLRPGDSVTIKRASLGSFLMLTPSRRSYRVERLK